MPRDLWHEIAHWLIASSKGQKLPGFGQGTVYDGSPGGHELPMEGYEEDASALGIWLQLRLGQDLDGADEHAREHDWGGFGMESHPFQHLATVQAYIKRRIMKRLRRAELLNPWEDPSFPYQLPHVGWPETSTDSPEEPIART